MGSAWRPSWLQEASSQHALRTGKRALAVSALLGSRSQGLGEMSPIPVEMKGEKHCSELIRKACWLKQQTNCYSCFHNHGVYKHPLCEGDFKYTHVKISHDKAVCWSDHRTGTEPIIATTTLTKSYSRQVSNTLINQVIIKIEIY